MLCDPASLLLLVLLDQLSDLLGGANDHQIPAGLSGAGGAVPFAQNVGPPGLESYLILMEAYVAEELPP